MDFGDSRGGPRTPDYGEPRAARMREQLDKEQLGHEEEGRSGGWASESGGMGRGRALTFPPPSTPPASV